MSTNKHGPTNKKTGLNGSRETQKKKRAMGLTTEDFDLNKNLNGRFADKTEGREARLPIVIKGMRESKGIREIAKELNVCPATIANDKRYVLQESWEIRKETMGLWLEEQLQKYDDLLRLLHKELMVEVMEKDGEGKWGAKQDEKGEPVLVINTKIMDRILVITDKVNGLKGLNQAPTFLLNTGDNATISIGQDATAAHELLDFIKSGQVADDKTSLVS